EVAADLGDHRVAGDEAHLGVARVDDVGAGGGEGLGGLLGHGVLLVGRAVRCVDNSRGQYLKCQLFPPGGRGPAVDGLLSPCLGGVAPDPGHNPTTEGVHTWVSTISRARPRTRSARTATRSRRPATRASTRPASSLRARAWTRTRQTRARTSSTT